MDVFKNQRGIFNPDDFQEYGITIIGCGSLGSFMAATLAKMGVKKFDLWDDDIVDEHNVTTQFYSKEWIDKPKVDAIKDFIIKQSPLPQHEITVNTHKKKFQIDSLIDSPIVIVCPDNMDTRKDAFEVAKTNDNVQLFMDMRMGGITYHIYTVDLTTDFDWYEKTLHKKEESANIPCTEKGIIFNVLGCCSFAASQLKKIFMNEPYDAQLMFGYDMMEVMKVV